MAKLAVENKIEAYNFSQGTLCHWFRALAGGKLGVFTDIGLETYLDPRQDGGKLNSRTTEDLVQLDRKSTRPLPKPSKTAAASSSFKSSGSSPAAISIPAW